MPARTGQGGRGDDGGARIVTVGKSDLRMLCVARRDDPCPHQDRLGEAVKGGWLGIAGNDECVI